MSPASIDCQSPSKRNLPFNLDSFSTENPTFFTLSNRNDCVFNSSLGSAKPRTKPRLTKVRRKLRGSVQEGNVSNGSSEASRSEGSNYSGFVFGGVRCDLKKDESCNDGGKVNFSSEKLFNNVDYVFGSNESKLEVNRKVEKRECGDNGVSNIKGEIGKSAKVGFVFSANESNLEEKRECGDNGVSNVGEESGKSVNVGFVFGANKVGLADNLSSEKREVDGGVGVGKSGLDEREKRELKSEGEGMTHENAGFVFGANGNNLDVSRNAGKRECDNGVSDIREELGKSVNLRFVFGANKIGLAETLSSEQRLFEDGGGKLGLDEREKTELKSGAEECATGENVSFVFGAKERVSGSTLNSKKGGGSNSLAEKQVIGEEYRKFDNMGFVFGTSWSKAASDINLGERIGGFDQEVKENGASSNTDRRGSSSVKGLHGNGVFVFGSSSNQSSVSEEVETTQTRNHVEMNKLDGESCVVSNGISRYHMDDIGFNAGSDSSVNGRCNFEFGISGGIGQTVKLPDEFRKLDINTGEANGIDKFKDFSRDSDTVTKNAFAFGSFKEVSSDFIGSMLHTSRVQSRTNSTGPLNGNSVDKTSDSDFQQNNCEFEASSPRRVERENEFIFSGTPDNLGASFTEFITPTWDPSCFKANLASELDKTLEFTAKGRSLKGKRSHKVKGKLRQSLVKQYPTQDSTPRKSSSQGSPESSGSPMDFSPYQETVAAEQWAKQTSVMSSDSSHLGNYCANSPVKSTVFENVKDDIYVAKEGLGANKEEEKCSNPRPDGFGYNMDRSFATNYYVHGFSFGATTTRLDTGMDQVCRSSVGIASADVGSGFSSNTGSQESKSREQFPSSSGLEDTVESNFAHSSSSSVRGTPSATRRRYRRKNRVQDGCNPSIITPSLNVNAESSSFQFSLSGSTSSCLDTGHVKEGEISCFQSRGGSVYETNKEQVKQVSWSASATLWEACENWRLRGNQAYKSRDLSKAEDCYTQGINAVPADEVAGCSFEPLVLCYSNRAATRMSLGRMREALTDCVLATALDPSFCKVHIRAANCHLLLGEVENAKQYFEKCLDSSNGVCLDRRITIEAADGIQKAQKVAVCTDTCAELLQQRTLDSASSTLNLISETLSISPYSETLLEMKAEALYILGKYGEVIQLCDQTLSFAEQNFALLEADKSTATVDVHNSFPRLWRWHLSSKSHFHLGKLEVALDLLEQNEQLESKIDNGKIKSLESSDLLAATVRELLHHKNAGNEAFKLGRHAEALEHYNAALSSQAKSLPFAAICFGNRAAAHQALGQIADAISDCSLAMALDGNYSKAVSRRATLHEMIRDYGQAASDLRTLLSILEKQTAEKTKQFSESGGPSPSAKEVKQARQRLSLMEEKVRKEIPLDLYLILEIKPSDTPSEIKKAYRKAALRHHPDKAGQFLLRSESTRDVGQLWKKISEEVRKDADRLFKMIGEAYAVLSDPDKRSDYDADEEMRKESHRSSTFRRESDNHYCPFGRSTNQRHQRETWKAYGKSHSRW